MKEKPQRRGARAATAIPARWGVTSECSRRGKIVNLSKSGCLLNTQLEPLAGQIIFLTFGLPTGHPIELRGEIAGYRRDVGYAIEFVDVSPDDQHTLDQLVEYYHEMGPDDPRHSLSVVDSYRQGLREIIGEEIAKNERDKKKQ